MSLPADLVQTDPGLAVLRMAALLAEDEGALDDELVDTMAAQLERGALAATPPAAMWPELRRGLMARAPSRMIDVLRRSGALDVVLPEFATLFGVPQLGDDQASVDIGVHTLRALADAARCGAPLAVRFALLAMHVGKSDSPPEHLPIHYRHIERAIPRIDDICVRFGVPDDCRELALEECERVHRVSEIRAGPVAAMLQRLGAFDRPQRYEQLMLLCACDYRAYGARFGAVYPKAELLDVALRACRTIPAGTAGDLEMAHAQAIATAFRSMRWSTDRA